MMLDRRTSAILTTINELCGSGSYTIVEKGELVSSFPKEQAPSDEELSRILGYLKSQGFLDLRYAEEGVYCVCPLPEGRRYFEQALLERRENRRHLRAVMLLSAASALIGSFIGALAAVLIAG